MNTDTSGKKPYHFGNLKETLIEQGIELIHEEGIEKFSLRKVAKKVGVSATACYNHFGNIDELLLGMYSYVTDRFATALKQAVEKTPVSMLQFPWALLMWSFCKISPLF